MTRNSAIFSGYGVGIHQSLRKVLGSARTEEVKKAIESGTAPNYGFNLIFSDMRS
jgi:hypothetical protein